VKDLDDVPQSVVAVLIKVHGKSGAFRVFSTPMFNIETGPEYSEKWIIVKVSGKGTMIFGSPSLRYFRRRHSTKIYA